MLLRILWKALWLSLQRALGQRVQSCCVVFEDVSFWGWWSHAEDISPLIGEVGVSRVNSEGTFISCSPKPVCAMNVHYKNITFCLSHISDFLYRQESGVAFWRGCYWGISALSLYMLRENGRGCICMCMVLHVETCTYVQRLCRDFVYCSWLLCSWFSELKALIIQ